MDQAIVACSTPPGRGAISVVRISGKEVKRIINNLFSLEFDHGTYALRISSLKDLRFIEQWYRMGKARNITEFKEAMKIHAIPMFNTVYADKDLKIYYV